MGTISLTYNRGLTSMTLHDFIILMTLPIGTSGYNEMQMILSIGTSGYNIRYTSEYIPKLQIHQHCLLTRKVFSWHNTSAQVFVTWSFIKARSSLDDHHRIIKTGSSSLDHHQGFRYLSILLVTGSSTEPTLFHAGCRPSLHVGIHLL